MLKINNLTKKYGDKCAVDNLSLHIEKGEIYAFIGHNGAGKTTTLKACCGIHDFDEGEILIDGKSIKTEPLACKQIISYIPDNPDLYDFLTGYQYIDFVADIFKVSKEERIERVKEYGQLFEITDALSQPISEYSHGMKQKVALIASFVHNAKLIIMDEPFVGLDPVSSHNLKQLMKNHCEKGGSIFFSTHVLEVAEKLCDKVAIIKNGKLVTCGDMEKVKGDSSLEAVFLELEEDK
ncbi:MAG: ABC transporter ATP-binding protein [Acutalibacteraceae bacterium]